MPRSIVFKLQARPSSFPRTTLLADHCRISRLAPPSAAARRPSSSRDTEIEVVESCWNPALLSCLIDGRGNPLGRTEASRVASIPRDGPRCPCDAHWQAESLIQEAADPHRSGNWEAEDQLTHHHLWPARQRSPSPPWATRVSRSGDSIMATTMTMDHHHHHHHHHQRLGALPFHAAAAYSAAPHFTNPWATSAAISPAQDFYASPHHLAPDLSDGAKVEAHRVAPGLAIASYALAPAIPPGTSSVLQETPAVLQDYQHLLSPAKTIASTYADPTAFSAAPSPIHGYTSTASAYDATGYAAVPLRTTYALASQDRRVSQPSTGSPISSYEGAIGRLPSHVGPATLHDKGISRDASRAFAQHVQQSKALDPMANDDPTPRNIYGAEGRAGRGSADSYGFPSTRSSCSSVSSLGGGTYATTSVASSVSDFSGAGSDVESVCSRTMSRSSLGGFGGAGDVPPAPQSMMGQFSSKISCSATKKHKCKVCDKRFTRPSSLQTHMYSHTGEKPFVCEVEGCGRHFSVVSNLRRHRKVHKGDALSEGGDDRMSVDEDE